MRAFGIPKSCQGLCTLLLLACGSASTTGPAAKSTPSATDPVLHESDLLHESLASRVVKPDTTYGALVQQLAELDAHGLAHSDEACLLSIAKGTGQWHLSADLAVAVRPLPETPVDLDAQLANRQASSVLTRWGHLGAGAKGPLLAALTTSPPSAREQALVIFVTDQGIYGRSSNVAVPIGWEGALKPEQLSALLRRQREQLSSSVDGIYITAERDIPLSQIKALLVDLTPLQVPVALAAALAKGTRQPPVKEPSSELLCPKGLPPLESGSTYGTLEPRQLQEARKTLQERAETCMEHASGTTAEGNMLNLATRLDQSGKIIQACFVTDEIGDVGLRRCVNQALKAVQFPAPEPAGIVDINIPLRFVYLPAFAQQPICH
jgi:hypothetical protein